MTLYPMVVDVEALLTAALNDQPEVRALLIKGIVSRIPDRPRYPLAILSQAGVYDVAGEPVWLVRSRMQIDVYGDSKQQARDAAATIHAVMHQRLPGSHDLGVVTGVVDETVMQYLPDAVTQRPRYVSIVWIYVHPNPAA